MGNGNTKYSILNKGYSMGEGENKTNLNTQVEKYINIKYQYIFPQ